MDSFVRLTESIPEIEKRIGYSFKDKSLLFLAFVHCSYTNEDKRVTGHNQRLEFLGDSVLGLLIADDLFHNLPDTDEGTLSRLRSYLVEASTCVEFAKKLNVFEFILLGKGERFNEGRGRDSILADLFEAIIGAIYLDGGIQAAKHFLHSHFRVEIDRIRSSPLKNWKALLQDYCQKEFRCTPTYEIKSESGPDHNKRFEIAVFLESKELGTGEGSSKKEAQQAAASAGFIFLQKQAGK